MAGTDLYFSNTSAAPNASLSSSREPPPKEMAVAWPTLVKLCVAHSAGPTRVDLLDGRGEREESIWDSATVQRDSATVCLSPAKAGSASSMVSECCSGSAVYPIRGTLSSFLPHQICLPTSTLKCVCHPPCNLLPQ